MGRFSGILISTCIAPRELTVVFIIKHTCLHVYIMLSDVILVIPVSYPYRVFANKQAVCSLLMENLVANQSDYGLKFSGPVSHVIKSFCEQVQKSAV
jgi:hypothetical protein